LTDPSTDVPDPSKKKRYHSLPATESLIFDVANFMLQGDGASTSREIVEYINFALEKSRRYTAPEIIGILRNRKMFVSTVGYSKNAGNRWRLDVKELARYIKSKNYGDRVEAKDLPEKVRRLKRKNIMATMNTLQKLIDDGDENDDVVDDVYFGLLGLWS